MSSREIAELTGKNHKDVMRDIRNMLDELGETSAQFCADLPDTYGRKQPALFMRNDQTKALVEEIGNSTNSQSFKSIAGRNGGTYVCKELVYAYAMWISAKFHLQVIRAYDALVAKQLNLFLLSGIDERGKHVVIASDCCSRRTHSVSIGLTQGNPAHGFSESETCRQPTSSPREGSATTQE